jgi:chromosome segregation ATPase
VRQNREIARVNSLQSLRIRSLESEVSHLLSENVLLRKQVINLTQETERLEAAKTLHDGIYDIKSKLDAKLAELSSLATDLGSLPRKMDKMWDEQSDRPKVAESRPRNQDSMGYDDGRLPAIVEDKYYPRRTLE